MGNKKVLRIPPVSVFSRYVRMGIPIYVLEESRIIDYEVDRNIPMTKSQ